MWMRGYRYAWGFSIESSARPVVSTYFQHILYNTIGKKITTANVGTVVLEEKDYQLAEITVKGERPQVKLEEAS